MSFVCKGRCAGGVSGRSGRLFLLGGLWLAGMGGAVIGCRGSTEQAYPSSPESGEPTQAMVSEQTAEQEESPATLLEPFDPPPLEELEAATEWIDQPVEDSLERLRARLAKQPQLVSEAEAMARENTSAEANAKILSVMCRLPESDDQVDWGATLVHHVAGEAKSLNPLMISSVTEMELLGLTGIGLLAVDQDFTTYGASEVVTSWQTSADHMVDKFVLRDDLTWSDGTPLTAHDFVFSFQTIMNPRVPVPAVRSGTEKLRWVHAYDDHTLVLWQKAPMASWMGNISFPLLPKHIYEKSVADDPTMENSEYHRQFLNKPITCGPYEYVSRQRGQEVTLRRRESYYLYDGQPVRPKPYFETIRFSIIEDSNTTLLALKKGDVDECILSAEQWLTQTDDDQFYQQHTKLRGVEWTEFHFVWNLKRPYFSDSRVRQAMACAFDHQEMKSSIFYDLVQLGRGPFHPAAWMASRKPQPYQQNLDRAEDLLAEAGWEDSDGDGILDKEINGRLVPFEFTVLTTSRPERVKCSTLLKDNLSQIGILCNVKIVEFTVLQDLSQKHNFDAMMAGWGAGSDPSSLDNIFKTGAERNYGEYSNPEVDRLFELAEREFDRTKRAALYARMHEIMWEDQPYMWLYHRPSLYGLNQELRGFNFSPRDPFGVSPGMLGLWKGK